MYIDLELLRMDTELELLRDRYERLHADYLLTCERLRKLEAETAPMRRQDGGMPNGDLAGYTMRRAEEAWAKWMAETRASDSEALKRLYTMGCEDEPPKGWLRAAFAEMEREHLQYITDALGDRWNWSGEDMSPADVRVNALSIVRGMVLDLKRVPKEFEALRAELAAAKKRIEELEFPNGDLKGLLRRVRAEKEAQDGE